MCCERNHLDSCLANEGAIDAAGFRYQLMHLPYFQSTIGPFKALRERNLREGAMRSVSLPLHQ